MSLPPADRGRPIAVLGPTNTGKTHLAVERMLGHRSGMIGFPLRLLAREVYDRVVARVGAGAAALITGEERRIPAQPRYFLCTVESMPAGRSVEFLAIDEVQLAGEPERGHIFTDRLLHARGRAETLFLGAETARPLIRQLVPETVFVTRPRFSKLVYAGPKKLTRLAPRSAIVAFSVEEVYAIAELIRRQRGGAAVVLGALSPRTRNAQVAMFQAGEVDYLVATDAIGMGLNMDVNHIAFAALTKFDGRRIRRLRLHEMAQIAGRAGRHMNDGTFGVRAELGPLAPEAVEALENHRFEPLRALYWRNPDLDFAHAGALLRSLNAPPPSAALTRAPEADDARALALLARDADIAPRLRSAAALRLLWDVCRIPDFRKLTPESHAQLLKHIFLHLEGPAGRLPAAWLGPRLERLERRDGDIDTLTQRIAAVRTWTYVAHRNEWLDDAAHWRERAHTIEETLSDTLHERLTQRFVDRRSAHLLRRMRGPGALLGAVKRGGDIVVEGHVVGRVDGFRWHLDSAPGKADARALKSAAWRILSDAAPRRVDELCADGEEAFAFDERGSIVWRGAAIARLARGSSILKPRIQVLASDLLHAAARERVRQRLAHTLERRIARELAPLVALAAARGLGGPARGLAYQIGEALGTLPCAAARAQLGALDEAARCALARCGVRLGRIHLYQREMMKPASRRLRAFLWSAHHGRPGVGALPDAGAVSVAADPAWPEDFYRAIGFALLGPRAVRADIAERIAAAARSASRAGPFAPGPELAALAACSGEALALLLQALGFRAVETPCGLRFDRPRRAHGTGKRPRRRDGPARKADRAASPFAVLRHLHAGEETPEG